MVIVENRGGQLTVSAPTLGGPFRGEFTKVAIDLQTAAKRTAQRARNLACKPMSAVISSCGLYRLRLDRDVQLHGIVAALFGVNPSTADAFIDDQTIRKDIGFAKLHGWRKIIKGNAFSYRATDVATLARCSDPIGPENSMYIEQIIAEADILVPCWGSRNKVPKALWSVLDGLMIKLMVSRKPVMAFGLTNSGDPKHTLTLGYDTKLVALQNGSES
jgi:hypothetical protein